MAFIRNRPLVNSAIGRTCVAVAVAITALVLGKPTFGADRISGQVLGAGAPIANSTVTVWAASAGNPKQLAQTRTGADGRFSLTPSRPPGVDSTLYLVAKGGRPTASATSGENPAIALMASVGAQPPARVTINEMTTVATVWTHTQFIDGTTFKLAAGARASRIRSMAARRRRWRTSPRWPTCSPVA